LAFVCDLGLDKIMVYRLDAARGLLTPNDPPFASVAPGSGPRHFAFHPNAHFAYVINEMASTVTAFEYDAAGGRLSAIQTITTLPADFHGSNTCAEIQVHPSGKFLYGSNRGHDSIAMFAIDGLTGKLSPLGFESTQGKTPRNFGLDPSGAFLLAANMASDNVVLFRIGADGKLTPTGQSVSVPAPVCVKMMPPLE
jgi:6-phosphogluconolactonase